MASPIHASLQSTCEFRFYEELGDFLAPARRKRSFLHAFDGTPSVKDRIEALGVPHTEVDLILVDGEPVPFSHRLTGGERVAVYPMFERFELGETNHLRPKPLREPRFVLDVHLGRLASYLRLLGFDALYRNDYEDDELQRISRAERRILLSRDTGLLKRSTVTHGAFLHATDPRHQLREVLDRFQLDARIAPFTRCARCNGKVASISVLPDEHDPDIREPAVPRPKKQGRVSNVIPSNVLPARSAAAAIAGRSTGPAAIWRDCGCGWRKSACRSDAVGQRYRTGSTASSGSALGSATGDGGVAGTSAGTATSCRSGTSIRALRQWPKR